MAQRVPTIARATPVKPVSERQAVATPGDAPTVRAGQRVSEDEIRLCAYLKWEAAGKPPGHGTCFWVDAERELLQPESSVWPRL
jgi:hypothetical protein